MGKRLFIKFIITYLLFFLFGFLFLYFYGEKAIGQNLYQREGQELYSEATRLANFYSKEENGALSLDRLSKEMEGNIHRSNVEWTLVDKDGKILQHKGKLSEATFTVYCLRNISWPRLPFREITKILPT